jgi:hypothetical protein
MTTATSEAFDPAMTTGFPEPARRWLCHAIAPGTPLRYPFGVQVEAEARSGGITIPSVFRAGWWRGTERQHEGEFFRAEITGAVFS